MRKTVINISLLAIFLLYQIKTIFSVDVDLYLGALAAIVTLGNIFYMGKTFKLPTMMFSILGFILLVYSRASLAAWLISFSDMVANVAILVSLQGLACAVNLGSYEDVICRYLRKNVKSPVILFVVLVMITHILAAVMTLGSVVIGLMIIVPLLSGILDHCDEYVANAMSVGYSTLFIWSPSGVTVLLCSQVYDIDWIDYSVPALILTALILLFTLGTGIIKFRKSEFSEYVEEAGENKACRVHVFDIVVVILALVAVILLLGKTGISNSTGRVVIASTIVAVVWLVILTGKEFMRKVPKDFWDHRLLANADLYCFFIAMGLFSSALSYSGADRVIVDLLMVSKGVLEVAILPVLPAFMTGLAIIGVHPFISIMIIGPVILSMNLGISAVMLALATSFGCCLSYMASPFSGLVLCMSNYTKVAPGRIAFKYNVLFNIVYYVVGVTGLLVLGRFF